MFFHNMVTVTSLTTVQIQIELNSDTHTIYDTIQYYIQLVLASQYWFSTLAWKLCITSDYFWPLVTTAIVLAFGGTWLLEQVFFFKGRN